MPNLAYRAGCRLEYGRRKHYIKRGWTVTRSSGSHGIWDLVGVRMEDPTHPVMFVQCKRCSSKSEAQGIINKFKKNPPMPPSPHWELRLEVQIKGSSEVLSVVL